MYLKRLEMLGFKSFATRTVLEFSPGITAVVGPNGAGKSNVADAIRWVLGEQSMRQLRGKKSDDIIFAGAHGKSPLGMAEVSLTLDNSTSWMPSEYSEITVTRRSYRSGENEYLINKQRVRLKDVILLLAQARIGHDSYTVIGQGLVDAALSLRAEERRGLLEDAAGIRPFQVQRAEAESRLRQTEQNLERLRDIVAEIEPRLAPLEEQARKALEFKEVDSELQEVLTAWYALQWRRLRAARDQAEATEQEQAQKVRQVEQFLQTAGEQGNMLRQKRQNIYSHIAEARKAWNQANDAVQRLERELAVSEERISGLARQRGEQQQEEQRLRERLISIQQQIIDQEEQCALADEAVASEAAALAAFEAQVAQAQQDYEVEERRLRAVQSDLFQVQARLGASQADLGRQQKHLGERNKTLAARREAIAQAEQSLRALNARLAEERSRLDTVHSEEQQVTQRKQALARVISDAQQESERLKSLLADAERQRRLVSDRLNMLKNWRQSLSGYSDGVRALLRTGAKTEQAPGFVGPVPQLGVAPAGMESALEAALGPYLQAVVVHTLDDAYACLVYLREKKAGKAMIAWMEEGRDGSALDDIEDAGYQQEEDALACYLAGRPSLKDRVVGFAWQHIECEPRYLPLFHRMLRGVVIARDGETARELIASAEADRASAAPEPPFQMVVTLDGEVFHTSGWLAGGSAKAGNQQGLLAYERELRELPRQLDEHIALIDQFNSMISEIQRAQEGRRAELATIDKELQKITGRINELNRNVTTTQREQERVQAELRLATSVEQQLAAEVAGLAQELEAAQERVRAHEKSQRELAGLVEELQRRVEEHSSIYRRQQDELGRKRTALAVKRQEARSLPQQLAIQQAQAQELQSQLDQQAARMKEAEEKQQALQESIASQRKELAAAQTRAQELAADLSTVEEEAREVDREIATLEQRSIQLRNTMSEVEAAYRRCLLESQKAQDALESLLTQLQEEMGIKARAMASIAPTLDVDAGSEEVRAMASIAPTLDVDVGTRFSVESASRETPETLSEEDETQLRKLRRRVDALRSRLRALGGCDPDAPQQYEETRTRFEFLTTQIADMEQAALHLRSIIGQLDATMARQFEMTFQAVNTRFREHFITLFNGGNARLELTALKADEDEEGNGSTPSSNMPVGVEIIVQPPGKKAQDLSLLSGGERALVSAALLFALLEINPPPFCLLDEVDAALDESNLARFCDILKRLAERTQFIVITHNRLTMAEAQVIYGISMGSDSVSRVISMKLDDLPVGVGGH